MRKHPVIWGVVLLVILGIISYGLFYKAGSQPDSIRTARFSFGQKIGVVPIEGMISDSFEVTQSIETFAKDDSILAVVLRIDSPGGGVAASQEIHSAVMSLRKKKKVVVSMGSVAASGGLLIACAADKIVANPGTITGSISALMQFTNLEVLLDKIGVKASVIKSGEYKDMGSPLRDMTPQEKEIIQELVDDIFNQFVDVVATGRELPRDKVVALADGRVFTGRRALELGLVDELGDLNVAARLAMDLSGRSGDYELVFPRKRRSGMLNYLMENAAHSMRDAIKEQSQISVGASYLYLP